MEKLRTRTRNADRWTELRFRSPRVARKIGELFAPAEPKSMFVTMIRGIYNSGMNHNIAVI